MRNLIILLAGALLLGSCNSGYQKTKSGLRYKIVKGKGGKQLKVGDFVQFHQIVSIPDRDTILANTYGKMHAYDRVDSGMRVQYSYGELLTKLSVGDSLVVVLSVDSLVKQGKIQGYNQIFRRGNSISFKMKITKSYATEPEVMADFEAERKIETERQQHEGMARMQEEGKRIEAQLAKNHEQFVKTPAGAYVVIRQKGTGTPDTGAVAQVYYTGKLFDGGTVFDSNVDPKFGNTTALPVSLGMGSTVKGFDEGLMVFGKGGKGTIYVPSFLGYGAQGNQRIPANSILVFDVEIRDIEGKPATPTMPAPTPAPGH